jgi:general secretion pathway protein A
MLEPYEKKDLKDYLEHCLEQAGAPQLMSKTLMDTLAEHSAGNLRLLNIMAAELLDIGAQQELAQLDEKLFLQIYSRNPRKNKSH